MENNENAEEEEKLYRRSRKNRIVTSICTMFCHLCFMVATIIVLVTDTRSCEYPIRAWLIVYIVLSLFGTIASLIIEIIVNRKRFSKKIIQRLYATYYFTMILFFIAWTILGSVWIYKDDECKNNFRSGWNLLCAILAINYGLFIVCTFAGCVGVVYVVALNYTKKLKQDEVQVLNR